MKYLLLLLISCVAHAKPFYLTVHRDFSPAEEPVVELDYENKAPFVLKVYRPKDMKEFIASQIDLSRAWRKPVVKENTARYLLQGINESQMGLDWIRATVDKKLRDPLKGKFGGGDFVRGKSRLVVGPDRIISAPDKFELISEQSYLPDERDLTAPFDVPGFNWWFRRNETVQTKPVKLPKLPVGFYVLQVVQGSTEGQVLLVVNDLAAQVQQSAEGGIVRVVDRQGSPVSGAKIDLRNVLGKWVADGKSDSDGVWQFNGKDQELIAIVEHKDSVAVVDTSFLPSVAFFPDLYLYSDRPLYRPGDTVEFKGVLKEAPSTLSRAGRLFGFGEKVRVHLESVGGTITDSVELPVSDFGTFVGKLAVPPDAAGVFRLKANLRDINHIGEVRVKEYVKPLFYVRVKSTKETLRPGETISADVKAERYGGGIPTNPRYKVELYRTRVDSPQWVEDAGLGETGSEVTYGWDDKQKPKNLLPTLVHSQSYEPMPENGQVTIQVRVPELPVEERNFDHSYSLQVTVGDQEDQFISGSATFIDTDSEVLAQAKITRAFVANGGKAFLKARSLTPSGKIYPNAKGSLEWWLSGYKSAPTKVMSQEFSTDARGVISLPVPSGNAGTLEARVSLRDEQGRVSRASAICLIGPKSTEPFVDVKEPVLLAANEVVGVGSSEKVLLLLPAQSKAFKRTVYVTVAGSRIFEQKVVRAEGNHLSISQKILPEYGTSAYLLASYFDPALGWQERKVGFRILPEEKLLTVSITPERQVLTPSSSQSLSLQVKDKTGKGVEAELSVSVVDQAVLDLQPEFRPSLLDFFYPMGRLNLMSFVSSEFQAYGYGEQVARLFRPNFRLGAAKTPEEKKPDERDTAYWNGIVKTDATGTAKISFVLPANQTRWIVTAVATDKSGKVGEGKSEFQAKTQVANAFGAPAVLRRGDELDLRFEISNNSKTDIKGKLELANSPGVRSLGGETNVSVGKGKTASYYHRIALDSLPADSKMRLGGSVTSSQKIEFSQPVRAVTDRVSWTDTVNVQDGIGLINLGTKERLEELEILLISGLSGLVLPTLDWMLVYPHGCVEQTTSTTIPNIAVKRVLTAAGVPSREVFRRADENVKAGLQRLAGYRNPKGGYGWYDQQSFDPYMSLNVILALTELETPGELAEAKVSNTLELLSNEYKDKSSHEALALNYVRAKLAKAGIISSLKGNNEFLAQMKLQGAKAIKEESGPLYRAYFLLTAKIAELDTHTELKDEIGAVVAGLKAQVSDPSKLTPSPWPGHIGREASIAAISGNALHTFKALDTRDARAITDFLVAKFKDGNFGSTYENAQVLIHSSWMMEIELKERKKQETPPVVSLGGKPLAATAATTLAGWRLKAKIPQVEPGAHTVTIPGARGKVVALKSVSGSDFQPFARGWSLTRKYFLVDESSGAIKEITNLELKVGDLVFVELTYQRAPVEGKLLWNTPYFFLEDAVPAGFIAIEEDKRYEAAPFKLPMREISYTRREFRPERISWYFQEKLMRSAGVQKRTGYLMRASYAGTFSAGPALVKEFYDEDQLARSPGARFTIRRAK